MSLVEPGQVFRFVSRDMDLTLLVVSLNTVFDEDRVLTTVLLIGVQRTVPRFRADLGQTTDWSFNRLDGEWNCLTRLW